MVTTYLLSREPKQFSDIISDSKVITVKIEFKDAESC